MPKCRSCDFLNPPGTDRCMNCGAEIELASPDPGNEADLESRLRSLLDQGRKIEAIKEYREATGAGLAEAKDAVEALEAGQVLPAKGLQKAPAGFEKELLALLEQGKRIQAIKLYREQTGTGLKEAKDALEAVAEKYGIPKGSGCAGVIVVVLVTGGMLASLVWQ